jgi:predicted alpha/beta-fold hydrolase
MSPRANLSEIIAKTSSLRGHYWTLGPYLRYNLFPPEVPKWQPWETSLEDEAVGTLRLSGRLSRGFGSSIVVVIVHGLGGSATSYYALNAARAAARAGIDSLRLNLRGADRSGADYYHAGLTQDLGGNMILRYLAGSPDPRVKAAASVCAPIDLERSARAIDQPRGAFYRRHVLKALKEIYRQVSTRRAVPLPWSEAQRIDTIEQWDERIIAPRHGFAGASDYWAQTSACHVLDEIDSPTLFVATEHDPMVLIDTVRPWLHNANRLCRIVTSRGGHVGFPQKVDLGLDIEGTVEDQVLKWMLAAT